MAAKDPDHVKDKSPAVEKSSVTRDKGSKETPNHVILHGAYRPLSDDFRSTDKSRYGYRSGE